MPEQWLFSKIIPVHKKGDKNGNLVKLFIVEQTTAHCLLCRQTIIIEAMMVIKIKLFGDFSIFKYDHNLCKYKIYFEGREFL